jgi:hypothetical protein
MIKLLKAGRKLIVVATVYAWIIGNILWMVILQVLGNSLGVSWLEVEHNLRVFALSPTMKEVHENKLKNGTADPEFSKNVKW